MFYGVIVSHMLVVLLAACGISGIVAYVQEVDTTAGYPAFLRGLAEASWPLAAAAALYMLVQIACQVQQMVLTQRMQGMTALGRAERGTNDDPYSAEKSQAASPWKTTDPHPAAANPTETTVKNQPRKPVSFFDISDAVIPPTPRPEPPAEAPDNGNLQPGAGQPQAASAEQTPSASTPAVAPASPSDGDTTSPSPGTAQTPPQQAQPEKNAHFFTLD